MAPAALAFAAVAVAAWLGAGTGVASASAMAVDCNGAQSGTQASCGFTPGANFAVYVRAAKAPSQGYTGFQTKLTWDPATLDYAPTKAVAVAADGGEIFWPEALLPLRSTATGSVVHGSISGIVPPFPTSSHEGVLLDLAFSCKTSGSSALTLVPGSADPLGSGYVLPSGAVETPSIANATVTCGAGLGGGGGGGVSAIGCDKLDGKAKRRCEGREQECDKFNGAAADACLLNAKRLAKCDRKKKSKKRRLCVRNAKRLAKCDTLRGKAKRLCVRNARRLKRCDKLRGKAKRRCVTKARRLKRCDKLRGKAKRRCAARARKLARRGSRS